MANEPRTIALGQHVLIGAKWEKNDGTLMEPYQNELPTWTTARSTIISCDPSTENPGCAKLRGLRLGATDISVIAKFNTNVGVRTFSWTINITVTEADEPQCEIILQHGSIVPL